MVELVQRVLNGEATRSEMKVLSKVILKDRVVRQYYLEMMMLHGALQDEFQTGDAQTRPGRQVIPFQQSGAGSGTLRRLRKPLAAAAAIAVTTTIAAITLLQSKPDAAPYEVVSIRGETTGNLPAIGAPLRDGQVLSLTAGTIEITSPDGNVLLFKGPGELKIVNQDLLQMRSGRLMAELNGAPIRIQVPNGIITDIGTTFGIHQQSAQSTRVDVFDGAVSFAHPQQSSLREVVTAGESLSLDGPDWDPVKGSADSGLYPPRVVMPLGFTFTMDPSLAPAIEASNAHDTVWSTATEPYGIRQLEGSPAHVKWVSSHLYSLIHVNHDSEQLLPRSRLCGKGWNADCRNAAKTLGFEETQDGIVVQFNQLQEWLDLTGSRGYQVTLWVSQKYEHTSKSLPEISLYASDTMADEPAIRWDQNADEILPDLPPTSRGVRIKQFDQTFTQDNLTIRLPSESSTIGPSTLTAVILTPVD